MALDPSLADSYVYAYLREDGSTYYVGKGRNRRAWVKHRVPVPKDPARIVMLKTGLSDYMAQVCEIMWIAFYGREDLNEGRLLNLTDGGDGSVGLVFTPESKARLAASMKRWQESPKYELYREHMRNLMTGHKQSPATIAKKVAKAIGRPLSEAHRQSLRNAKRPPRTAEALAKSSAALLGRTQSKSTCPHCGKTGGSQTMPRWHFDNCKELF